MYMPRSPFVLCLELTSQCNLNCPHCVANADSTGKKLPLDMAISIIDEAQRIGIKEIVLGGGEVLLYENFFDTCKRVLSNGLDLSFASNGILVPSKINSLMDLKKYGGLFRIGISLDGHTSEIHGYFRPRETFTSAIKAINILNEVGIDVHILCVLNKANIQKIPEFLEFISNFNISNVRFIPLMPIGRGIQYKEEMILPDELYNILKEKQKWNKSYRINIGLHMPWEFAFLPSEKRHPSPCEAGYLRLWINSNGDMFPCAYMPDLYVGNIYHDTISDVWLNSPILKRLRDSSLLKGSCSACSYRDGCRGGCRGLAQFLEGDFLCSDPYCPIANQR